MDLMEVTETIGFWILGGTGTAMVLIGWILSRNWEMAAASWWQILIFIIIIWLVSAFWVAKFSDT